MPEQRKNSGVRISIEASGPRDGDLHPSAPATMKSLTMNPRTAIQGAYRKRLKLHRRPIGARIDRLRRAPVFVCQQDDLQTLRSLGGGRQNPVIEIGLDSEQFCVRLFETEFEEVA